MIQGGRDGEPAGRPRPQTSWAHARRAFAELAPDAIEQIAGRVAELLRSEAAPKLHASPDVIPPTLLSADQLARHLGLSRAWVYEHSEQLGAIRLGAGPRARLRFDLQRATDALGARVADPKPADRAPAPGAPRRGRRPPGQASAPLLPVRPLRARGVFFRRRRRS